MSTPSVNYQHAIGATVAFAKKHGVSRGVIEGVEISIGRKGVAIEYRIEVKNAGAANDRDYSRDKSHIETAKGEHVAATLDDAFAIYERGVFGND